ncbi:hypothetical protein OZX67_08945 [Bifidobacterium sp. ESL0728]|uniref:YobI family P-loop NTPase n=1 Tax=Bifidobacterium sp. ESL0728 TaxID=2983220 RepID=UPI0023F9EDA5|nr:hypothetical protein [Bifidobacterium sp. ESL0728]WEV58896.1 hypothetical protein OZX67_08945 [Bifidobacterium sp. ESL0728]
MIQPSLSIKDTVFLVIIVILVALGFLLAHKYSTYSKMNQSENTSFLAHFWFSTHSWFHNHWNNVVKRFHDYTRYRREDYQENSSDNNHNDNELYSLTPEYRPEEHKIYVKYLVDALEDNRNHNIALSGIYGSGKSSILDGLRHDSIWGKHTFTISLLATLASQKNEESGGKPKPDSGNQTSDKNGDDHEKKDETDSAANKGININIYPQNAEAATEKPHTKNQNHEIQRAIVKQLIFANKPTRARQSRYALTHKSSYSDIALKSFFIALLAMTIIMTFVKEPFKGFIQTLELQDSSLINFFSDHLPSYLNNISIGQALISFALSFILCFAFLYFSGSNFHLSTISIGKTTIDFNNQQSYLFKDSFDEIIYFFETNPKDSVIIFEDLDRFDNPEIFYELHELNTILNKAPTIHQTVRFIYATKDSIFDDPSQNSGEEQPGINESKFFDSIIHVIPFLSITNAFEYEKGLFKDIWNKQDVQNVLIILNKYLYDMRLLKEIANNYHLTATLFGTTFPEGREAKFLAIIAYQIFYPHDAEQIISGHSKLGEIFNYYHAIVKYSEAILERQKLNDDFRTILDHKNLPLSPIGQDKDPTSLEAFINHCFGLDEDETNLAKDLLEAGHIDENFDFYTFRTTDTGNLKGIKFIRDVLNKPNGFDPDFQLDPDDLNDLWFQRNWNNCQTVAIFNFDILEFILNQLAKDDDSEEEKYEKMLNHILGKINEQYDNKENEQYD